MLSALRKDLRAISADGTAASVMVGVGETYLPAFVLALSASDLASGLISSVPLVIGALVQLAAPRIIRRLGSYRRWVVLCAVVQALAFVPLVCAALLGAMPVLLVFAVVSVYWAAGMAGGATWNTWVGTLVPERIRPRYFARRTRWCQAGMLIGFVGGGVALQLGTHAGYCLVTFSLLFLAATLSRLASSLLLTCQSEPQPPGPELMLPDLRRLMRALLQDDTGRLFLYLLGAQAAVQIAGPYFNPYMLDCLKLPYFQYVALICAAYCAKILCLPAFGKLAGRWGAERLLWCGGIAIIPTSALWLVSSSFGYLLAIQVFSGVAWAAYELAMFLLAFEAIPDQRRMAVMTAFNLANATAIFVGSILGGGLLILWGVTRQAYLALFLISSIARVFAILLLLCAPGVSLRAQWAAIQARLWAAVAARVRPAAMPRPTPSLARPHWQLRKVVVVHSEVEAETESGEPAAPSAQVATYEEV